MRSRCAVVVWSIHALAAAACGGSNPPAGPDAFAGPDAGPVTMPPTTCDVPTAGKPVDASHPTTVVGTGTADSCTGAALQAAVDKGGVIAFDCGPDPATITVTKPITINNKAGADMLGDTVIDGGGKVTLSGGGTSRILLLDACQNANSAHCDTFPHPVLTVQRLTFTGGADDSVAGGGAIYRHGGSLVVIDSQFFDNHCKTSGGDTSGGAIRLDFQTPALIVGSVFGQPGHGNACTNGGAVGSLQAAPVTIVNSVFDSNRATGDDGTSGGNGGSISHDGVNTKLSLCGVKLRNSVGNAYGGGIFYVDNFGNGTVEITNSEITDATIPAHAGHPSHGGAGYLQGATITITDTTIADTGAIFAAGLYVNGMNGKGSLDATNLTVTGIQGDALVIEGVGGTLLNTTIAGNARGLAGGGVSNMHLVNSIIAGNSLDACQAPPVSGGGNLQFPGATCGAGITTADPALGALADNGGTTGVRTMAPAAASPALGAGNGCPSTDARGMARPASGCTSGAHQAP
jgi:hypothetical protein